MPELMLPIYYAHAAYLTPCVEISILMPELMVPIFHALQSVINGHAQIDSCTYILMPAIKPRMEPFCKSGYEL